MNSKHKYKSLSFNPFDTWRILFYGFIVLSILFGIIFHDLSFAMKTSGIVIGVICFFQMAITYSEVTLERGYLKLQNFEKIVHLDNLDNIETWWCYDFGISSIELSEGTQGKTRALSNRINCYVKFVGNGEEAFIYEQIHLGEKFPNGHKYLANQEIDESRTIKVWDIDKCLSKLKIEMNAADY